jgi:hypothetical protein
MFVSRLTGSIVPVKMGGAKLNLTGPPAGSPAQRAAFRGKGGDWRARANSCAARLSRRPLVPQECIRAPAEMAVIEGSFVVGEEQREAVWKLLSSSGLPQRALAQMAAEGGGSSAAGGGGGGDASAAHGPFLLTVRREVRDPRGRRQVAVVVVVAAVVIVVVVLTTASEAPHTCIEPR